MSGFSSSNSSTAGGTGGAPTVARSRRSSAACRRCHTHKIKCSGGTPCRGCIRSRKADECVYPRKEKKVTVSESFIKNLEAERERLKRAIEKPQLGSAYEDGEDDAAMAAEVANPVMEQRAEFASAPKPVYVGAAACTAFADLVWHHVQTSSGSSQSAVCASTSTCTNTTSSPSSPAPSAPRQVAVFNHPTLRRAMIDGCHEFRTGSGAAPALALPSQSYATLLAQVVLKFVGQDYHLVRKRSFLEKVDQVYARSARSGVSYDGTPSAAPPDRRFLCRMFITFALGELYLRKSAVTTDGQQAIPGTHFYLQAVELFEEHYEDPDIEYIETLLLMSFYSHALNRKNSAYNYAGMALRLSVALGLHRNMTYGAETPAVEIENRRRVWWTVYMFDRLCSSKLGHPVMIKDADIDAPLPSMDGLTADERDDFFDAAHLVANIGLARITGRLLDLAYKIHRPHERTFIRDIHQILTSLKEWEASLPADLRPGPTKTPSYVSRPVASLRLHFNQCVILTTRPVLLFVFRGYVRQQTPSASPTVMALSEACIVAARASHRLLKQLWMDGAIATFGYFDAHYIFSSTLVLVLASLLNRHSSADRDAVGLSLQLLQSMADDGNLPARELLDRLVSLQRNLAASVHPLAAATADLDHPHVLLGPSPSSSSPSAVFRAAESTVTPQQPLPSTSSPPGESPSSSTAPTMILEDPFLRQFLGLPYSERSPSALGMTNDEIFGISSLAWDIETLAKEN
ncbi:c6 zinc finger domain containing protein [Grosmannia clavigera kw1407]|uniref:C6 zinc finger domain containing protein n=1 Tax=Grosmannia clavigera (strain kw1407 / UAMH 11150) TaxID=655863 RepID=F0X9J1_GROCL|nr:c6 zinc finger domain containing protein [Grosmannia clavigera kw1407]EFX06169.1 c6 zinc finger domain containing protein [Grosmannia clavigera kw1407]